MEQEIYFILSAIINLILVMMVIIKSKQNRDLNLNIDSIGRALNEVRVQYDHAHDRAIDLKENIHNLKAKINQKDREASE